MYICTGLDTLITVAVQYRLVLGRCLTCANKSFVKTIDLLVYAVSGSSYDGSTWMKGLVVIWRVLSMHINCRYSSGNGCSDIESQTGSDPLLVRS
jgi:hypothetical protein